MINCMKIHFLFLKGLKNIAGPVYLNQNNSHNFDVIEKHLETLKQVNG